MRHHRPALPNRRSAWARSSFRASTARYCTWQPAAACLHRRAFSALCSLAPQPHPAAGTWPLAHVPTATHPRGPRCVLVASPLITPTSRRALRRPSAARWPAFALPLAVPCRRLCAARRRSSRRRSRPSVPHMTFSRPPASTDAPAASTAVPSPPFAYSSAPAAAAAAAAAAPYRSKRATRGKKDTENGRPAAESGDNGQNTGRTVAETWRIIGRMADMRQKRGRMAAESWLTVTAESGGRAADGRENRGRIARKNGRTAAEYSLVTVKFEFARHFVPPKKHNPTRQPPLREPDVGEPRTPRRRIQRRAGLCSPVRDCMSAGRWNTLYSVAHGARISSSVHVPMPIPPLDRNFEVAGPERPMKPTWFCRTWLCTR